MLISLNKWKWLRIRLKKMMVKNSFIEKTYVVGTQFQSVPMTYVTENKEENYLETYIFQV